jgi:hypothetical protein
MVLVVRTLKPSGYERPTLSGKFNKNRDFW